MAMTDEGRSLDARTIPSLIRWHGYAALASVLYVALLGLVMAIRLHAPDWLGGVAWLSWGRLRYAHTQGVFFGWLGNAFLAFLYYAVPRLAGRPVTSVRLGWVLFVVWNFLVVLPGWALVQAGFSQPLEWAEFPLPVDAAATLGLLLACVQFVVPLLAGQGAEPVRLGLVHPGRPDVHPAGLPRRQRRARTTCPGARGRPSAGCGFTTPSACSSRRWPWPSPTPSSRPSPAGRSTATFCR